MNEYLVTARKWRPMRFEDVVGQHHVTATLRNAVLSGRLAHAYLFSGPRGVGKTTTARLLAKVVNCVNPRDANPDNECEPCKEITEGRSFDVLEIDGASTRGVEEIRNLRESVRYAPGKGRYKVYIIDEVHMLTKEAFNALLKTLEEPPPHVLFIFATTEIHKVPPTILSRCQRFDFRRIGVDEITANLKGIAREEGLELDDDTLLLIAKKGDGSLRDAQSIFDQVISLCGRTVTHEQILEALNIVDQEVYFRVTDLVKANDAKGGLALVDELLGRGHDIKEFLGGLAEHLRNLMVAKTTGSTSLIETSDVFRKRYAKESQDFSIADLLRLQKLVTATETAIGRSSQPRFRLEADLVQMISMVRAPEVASILALIEELKKKLSEHQPLTSTTDPPQPRHTARASAPPILSPQKPAPIAGAAATPARSVAGPPIGAGAGMPAQADVAAGWSDFVAEVRRHRISLGSVLESTTLLGVSNGAVRIGCSNDFQASTLMRNRDVLSEILQNVLHAPVRLEVVAERSGDAAASAHGPSEASQAHPLSDDHPVIAALKRELGAEPLE